MSNILTPSYMRDLGRPPTTIADWSRAFTSDRDARPTKAWGMWTRGDSPAVAHDHGNGVTTAVFRDTWIAPTSDEYRLTRNTVVTVSDTGHVAWWPRTTTIHESDPADAIAPHNTSDGAWFWPVGAWIHDHETGEVAVWGETRLQVYGNPFGAYDGPTVVSVANYGDHMIVGPPVRVGLPLSHRWGAPALIDAADPAAGVVSIGWNAATWGHAIATCQGDMAKPADWQISDLPIERGPFAAPQLINWRHGWLAVAKPFQSAPGLGYPESPGVVGWWSPTLIGSEPWARLPALVDDTTSPGWWTYDATLLNLPRTGLVACWSRNTFLSHYQAGGYGPVLAAPRMPAWADLPNPVVPGD